MSTSHYSPHDCRNSTRRLRHVALIRRICRRPRPAPSGDRTPPGLVRSPPRMARAAPAARASGGTARRRRNEGRPHAAGSASSQRRGRRSPRWRAGVAPRRHSPPRARGRRPAPTIIEHAGFCREGGHTPQSRPGCAPDETVEGDRVSPELIRRSMQAIRRELMRLALKRIGPARIIVRSCWRHAHQVHARTAPDAERDRSTRVRHVVAVLRQLHTTKLLKSLDSPYRSVAARCKPPEISTLQPLVSTRLCP